MADVIDDLQDAQEQDFFSTPELTVPKTPPDAHRGVVTSVTSKILNNDKQTAVISVNLVSQNVPTLETSMDIFLPKMFEENIGAGSKFDVLSMPEEEGNKQQTNYRMGIANSDKTATLQLLVFNKDSVARAANRDPVDLDLKKNPQNLDEYTENLNKMLQGVECIFLRRERGGDNPAFAHQLQVREILPADEFEKNPKRFKPYNEATKKGYVLAWEQ